MMYLILWVFSAACSTHIAGLRFMTTSFEDISRPCIKEGKFSKFLDPTDPVSYVKLDGPRKGNVSTFDCDIEVQTVLRAVGDKQMLEMEALSLIILELNYSQPRQDHVKVITNSYFGQKVVTVTQEASYGTNRLWSTSPTFLLSGQITGFDPIDTRHRTRSIINEQHLFPPDRILSKFDTPASIQVKLRRWNEHSKLYLVFTSYRLLTNGEHCTEGTEFECPTSSHFKSSLGRLCMSFSLACDGLPNCGESHIPNPDEACFQIHWSNVLLSLVSYILLAITLLLCMSCFARIVIQWSVRSAHYELRSDSIRSSSRLFSFFGGSFSRRWERPPPTYDEALKHFNPDSGYRPPNPPPYSDNFRPSRLPLSRSLQALRSTGSFFSTGGSSGSSGIRTPPPDYSSCEDMRLRPPQLSLESNRRILTAEISSQGIIDPISSPGSSSATPEEPSSRPDEGKLNQGDTLILDKPDLMIQDDGLGPGWSQQQQSQDDPEETPDVQFKLPSPPSGGASFAARGLGGGSSTSGLNFVAKFSLGPLKGTGTALNNSGNNNKSGNSPVGRSSPPVSSGNFGATAANSCSPSTADTSFGATAKFSSNRASVRGSPSVDFGVKFPECGVGGGKEFSGKGAGRRSNSHGSGSGLRSPAEGRGQPGARLAFSVGDDLAWAATAATAEIKAAGPENDLQQRVGAAGGQQLVRTGKSGLLLLTDEDTPMMMDEDDTVRD